MHMVILYLALWYVHFIPVVWPKCQSHYTLLHLDIVLIKINLNTD